MAKPAASRKKSRRLIASLWEAFGAAADLCWRVISLVQNFLS
jgi:hypothetical protein